MGHVTSLPPRRTGIRSFDEVFVINLKNRTDRRHDMERELESVGLSRADVIWFDAVRPEEPAGFQSIGARGCFLSHLGIIRLAAARGLSSVLILEDDVEFGPGSASRMDAIAEEIAGLEWDVFYGGGDVDKTEPQSSRLVRVDPGVSILLSHCIALRGAAISRIAAYLEAQLQRPAGDPAGGPMHIDGAYSWARRELGLTTFLARPEICYQRASSSDIYESKRWDAHPLLRGLTDRLRAVMRYANKYFSTLIRSVRAR